MQTFLKRIYKHGIFIICPVNFTNIIWLISCHCKNHSKKNIRSSDCLCSRSHSGDKPATTCLLHSVLYCFCLYNPNKRLFSFVEYASYSDKSSKQLTMAATQNQKCLRCHVRLICLIKDSIYNKNKGHFYRVYISKEGLGFNRDWPSVLLYLYFLYRFFWVPFMSSLIREKFKADQRAYELVALRSSSAQKESINLM